MSSTNASAELVTTTGALTVEATVAQLVSLVEAKGMRLSAVIDQAAEAGQAGLSLRPTTLVLFGHPLAGTAVMEAFPEAGIDLPLKVLIWADGETTHVTYLSPRALAARPGLTDDVTANLAGIDPPH